MPSARACRCSRASTSSRFARFAQGVTRFIPPDAARRLLGDAVLRRPRLAYRDVSSATNRLTLIAAVVPPACVTVHTLFCLRTPLSPRSQSYLCGILNSLVANFLVRFWVSSHVTTAIVGRLPVPRADPASRAFLRISSLAARLARSGDPVADAAYPRLQGEVARLYGLSQAEFERILDTFPLLDSGMKAASVDGSGRGDGVRLCAGVIASHHRDEHASQQDDQHRGGEPEEGPVPLQGVVGNRDDHPRDGGGHQDDQARAGEAG